jgi:hypothetical protein
MAGRKCKINHSAAQRATFVEHILQNRIKRLRQRRKPGNRRVLFRKRERRRDDQAQQQTTHYVLLTHV